MDLISRESLINKLDLWYKKIKKTAPNNLAEGFMQVDGLIRHEPSAFEGMTNGEVIRAMFPNSKTETISFNGIRLYIDDEAHTKIADFTYRWWNAPYQKGGRNAVEIEDIKSEDKEKEEALEHAKTLKEFCRDRDNLDEPCEDCPFHLYDGFAGFCVLNYGLYPNEWFMPKAESEDKAE